jgi:hypothetical protein
VDGSEGRDTVIRRLALILAGFSVFALILASPAAASTTYHGVLTDGQFLCGTTEVDGPAVTGNWNLNIDNNTNGGVHINVFYDGGHHLSFGYNGLVLQSYEGGVYTFSGFGGTATATFDSNTGGFTWHVVLGGGCPPDRPYDSLTYLGSTTQG